MYRGREHIVLSTQRKEANHERIKDMAAAVTPSACPALQP
jgi:hypothetical protein